MVSMYFLWVTSVGTPPHGQRTYPTRIAPIRLPHCLLSVSISVYPAPPAIEQKRKPLVGGQRPPLHTDWFTAARHSWSAARTFKFAQPAAASGRGTCRHPVPGQWQSASCPAPKEGLGNLGFQADFWFLLFSDKRNPPPERRNNSPKTETADRKFRSAVFMLITQPARQDR